jgi:hypothetical protein
VFAGNQCPSEIGGLENSDGHAFSITVVLPDPTEQSNAILVTVAESLVRVVTYGASEDTVRDVLAETGIYEAPVTHLHVGQTQVDSWGFRFDDGINAPGDNFRFFLTRDWQLDNLCQNNQPTPRGCR